MTAPDARSAIQTTRWLAVGSLIGLMAVGLAWEMVVAPLRRAAHGGP